MTNKWQKIKLGEVCKPQKGLTYKSDDYSDETNGQVFITLKCIAKGGGFNKDGIKYIKRADRSEILKSGDLIIANTDLTRAGDVIGAPLFVPKLNGENEYIYSMDISRLEVESSKLNYKYLYQFLLTNYARNYMRGISNGSTVLHLKVNLIDKLPIPLPDVETQKKIAEILFSVDEAIQKTDQIIQKTEELKNGLMNSFLNGKSKNWKQFTLGDLCNFTTGKLNSNQAVENGKYPFFTCAQETFAIDRYSFDTEAVLLAGNNAAGIYSVKHYKGKFDAYQRTYVITVKNEDDLDYYYLKELLNTKLNMLKDYSVGTNTKFLTLKLLLNIKVTLPDLKTQKHIADTLRSIEIKNDFEIKNGEHLRMVKTGLMQDIFSQKVTIN